MTKFQLQSFNRNIPDNELLEDLQRAYRELVKNGQKLTFRSYGEVGKYTAGTFSARFGSWNSALIQAGLETNEVKDVGELDLFKNLETVWISKGKQPVWRDMDKAPSKYGPGIYKDRFGSWRKALKEFVDFINNDENDLDETESESTATNLTNNVEKKVKRTSRSISERMRFRILVRDGFTCQSCGRSPLKERGVELHVDHIIPWSKGGETEVDNLEVKCSRCNLGKGNAFNK